MLGGLWQGHWVERAAYSRHIGGMVIGYRPGWMKARKLTALLLAARYLQDPYRTDELYIGTIVSMTWERLSPAGEEPDARTRSPLDCVFIRLSQRSL